jgi:LysR family transcriptional regulator, transcriptional activator of nhaA
MLNLNHLRYFYVTAQMKSVTKAAEFLSISQPSLSQQLNTFEENLGFPVYYRNGRSLDLTPKGKILYEKAASVFINVDDINNFIEKKQTSTQDIYSVAVSDEIERPFISEIVGKLVHSKISENIKFDVISKPQYEIVTEFYNSKHQLLLTNRSLKKHTPARVFEFPVNLITSLQGEVIHKIKGTSLKSLIMGLQEKFVLPSHGLTLREEIDEHLGEVNFEPDITFESNILSCVTRAITQKVGCSLIPTPYVYDDIKNKKISVLGPKKGFWQHRIYLYSKKSIHQDLVGQKIITNIQSYLNFE